MSQQQAPQIPAARSSAAPNRSPSFGINSPQPSIGAASLSSSQLTLDFTPFEPIHQWKRMLECDEFVGARRSKHTVIPYKEAIYVFGGDNGTKMLNDLIRFDVKDKSWGRAVTTGSPPAARYHHSAVVHDTSMFVFGGYTGDIHSNLNLENKNDLFEYKFQNGQWLEWRYSGTAPVPRSAHGAAVYDNKLWIYAGYDGHVRLNDMWTMSLNSDSHQWEEVEQHGDQPPTCCNFPVAVSGDCMYVFSGQSGLQITNALFEFNFKTKTWRRISNEHILRVTPPPPARRYGHTMVTHDNFLYVFAGSADNTLPNDLYCYDLEAEVWSVVIPETDSQIPSGRVFHAAAVVCDAMYIFGGTVDNNIRSGDMFRFQFSTYPRCTLHNDFGRFLKEKQFCDVEFVVGSEGTRIQAHVAMLAARSPYLREQILTARAAISEQAEDEENTSSEVPLAERPMLVLELPNAEPEAFQVILTYIYTDRIDFDKRHSDRIVILMMDIYQLAVQFLVRSLERVCLQYLEYKISKKNVLDALFHADKLNLSLIKEMCLSFIVKPENMYEIVMSEEFLAIDKPQMVDIIRRRFGPIKLEVKIDKIEGTTLENDLAVFLKTGGQPFCDINLVLDGEIVPAHSSIMLARSTYFQAMFRSFRPTENSVNIQIGDISPSKQAFHSLLRFIYYGDKKMPPEDSLFLFQAPCFYGFTNNRLQAFCKYNLEHNINPDNVLDILEASEKMSLPDVKQYALRMIVRDFSPVVRMPKMKTLSRELLLAVIEAMAEVIKEVAFKPEYASISVHSDL